MMDMLTFGIDAWVGAVMVLTVIFALLSWSSERRRR